MIRGLMYEVRAMSRVLPSLCATSSTASSTFFSACMGSSVAPSSASLTAASSVPAQVRKSFGVNSSPIVSLT
jgi:hypothetical protein